MNIVFISCRKTMLIYAIVQMTVMDLVALDCIPCLLAVYRGTRQSKTCGGNSETCQDDDITNFGGNSETFQDDNIVVLYTNIVFISCRKTMLIYAIAQMTIIDLVALSCIPWHSVVYQGTRLYYEALISIPRDSTLTQID
jgi:hypothetical protein